MTRTGDATAADAADAGDAAAGGDGAGRLRRTWTAAVVGGREVLRDPALLGLLVVLPAYFVGVWGEIVPDDELPLSIPTASGSETVTVSLADAMVATMAPVAAALLVGIAGLFLVQRTTETDRRLGIVGYGRVELLASRIAVLGAVAAVVVAIASVATTYHLWPASPGWFVVAVALVAGAYGAVGLALGHVLDKLPGVYVLLFAPTIDVVVLQNPLAESPDWAAWLPGHHATQLALSAAFADSVATEHALWGLAVVAALSLVAAVVATVQRD